LLKESQDFQGMYLIIPSGAGSQKKGDGERIYVGKGRKSRTGKERGEIINL